MFDLLYNFNGLNQLIFHIINKYTNITLLPKILQIISWLFNIENFAVYYVTYVAYITFQLKREKRYINIKSNYWFYYNYLFRTGITYTVFGLTYAFLKFSINLSRPFCSLDHYLTIKNITLERCLSSFPSSHVGIAIIIAYSLWPFICNTIKKMFILMIILVAISRITLAMHYPSDVIYSGIITNLVIWLGNFITIKLKKISDIIGNFLYNFI